MKKLALLVVILVSGYLLAEARVNEVPLPPPDARLDVPSIPGPTEEWIDIGEGVKFYVLQRDQALYIIFKYKDTIIVKEHWAVGGCPA